MSLAEKIRNNYARGGVRELLAVAGRKLDNLTRRRLDLYLFYDHKWTYVRRWMLSPLYHRLFRALGFIEAEHQLGRLMHMREALLTLKAAGVQGDLVEFGSYQGFSLYWLARFRDELGMDFRIIGVDSFEGLPVSSTIWKQGLFSDTSREACERAVLAALGGGTLEEHKIYVVQGLFNAPAVAERLLSLTRRIAAAHVDCDLGSSASQALDLVLKAGVTEPFALLFDDWYWHQEEIPASFEVFLKTRLPGAAARELSRTRYTRYLLVSGAAR